MSPSPGPSRPATRRQQHQLDPGGLGPRVRVASRRVKMPPEGLGHPALREPRPRRAILALAPALEGQVQDAFIATHPRGGGFVALLAAARAGPPGRGGATGPRSGPRPASASSATSRQTRWSVPMQNSPDLLARALQNPTLLEAELGRRRARDGTDRDVLAWVEATFRRGPHSRRGEL